MRRLLIAACFAGVATTPLLAQQPDPVPPNGSAGDSLPLSRAQAIAQALGNKGIRGGINRNHSY